MGRADHPGPIVEQHRRAIGGQHAEQDARAIGDEGIGSGPVGCRPRVVTVTTSGEWT
jgi:hypothetical protein